MPPIPLSRRAFLAATASAVSTTVAPALAASGKIALPGDLSSAEGYTITSVATRARKIAMTFDDGPHPSLTPRLLDTLASLGVRATFYLIGNRVRQWPKIAERIAAEGHEIGNHSWSHPFLNRYGDTAMMREIDTTTLAIFDATGRAPVTFRPPYGAFTARQRRVLHESRRLPTVLWSVDPRDWRRPGASVVSQRILRGTRPGAIILSHDIHRGTVAAMPHTLGQLLQSGYQFQTISQILGWPDWHSLRFRRRTS